MNFVSWWETGIALIIFNIMLFCLVVISFGIGFKKHVVKNSEKKQVIKIEKSNFSTLAFFAFLSFWTFLTVFMAVKGWM